MAPTGYSMGIHMSTPEVSLSVTPVSPSKCWCTLWNISNFRIPSFAFCKTLLVILWVMVIPPNWFWRSMCCLLSVSFLWCSCQANQKKSVWKRVQETSVRATYCFPKSAHYPGFTPMGGCVQRSSMDGVRCFSLPPKTSLSAVEQLYKTLSIPFSNSVCGVYGEFAK